MIYFVVNASGSAILGTVESRREMVEKFGERCALVSRHDYKALADAEMWATRATKELGALFIATDEGPSCWPRFDVIEAPKVGDQVSYAFNGDAYPDGEIVAVSPSMQVRTSTGNVYYRRKQTGNWKKKGGTWSLVHGHHNERNPSF